jgi:hypothetical protein
MKAISIIILLILSISCQKSHSGMDTVDVVFNNNSIHKSIIIESAENYDNVCVNYTFNHTDFSKNIINEIIFGSTYFYNVEKGFKYTNIFSNYSGAFRNDEYNVIVDR